MLKFDDARTVLPDVRHGMRDEDERRAAGEQAIDAFFAFTGEIGVADRHHFVHQQDFRLDGRRDAETESRLHAGGIGKDRRVDKRPDVREIDDIVHQRVHLGARTPLQNAIENDIFAPGKLGTETRPQREHHGNASAHFQVALEAAVDPADNREQRRLAAAVRPDQTDPLAPVYLEIDMVERRENLGLLAVADILRQVQDDVFEAVVTRLQGKAHRHIIQFHYRFVHYIISAKPASILRNTK